ncbi:hypothetical protein LR48_Vigan07g079100 [Vigna angularis]|uniref:Uncharacterized protein n=1 Tax=Phaseolus angularis TaxID=3914 RepID=A0A0L9UWZ1_PHAAN|nr:hypothetical protein LR48_Vigan07g079100 [Vigna angularis]
MVGQGCQPGWAAIWFCWPVTLDARSCWRTWVDVRFMTDLGGSLGLCAVGQRSLGRLVLALDQGGRSVLVLDRGGRSVLVLDRGGRSVLVLDTGGRSVLVLDTGGRSILVLDTGGRSVLVLDTGGRSVLLLDLGGRSVPDCGVPVGAGEFLRYFGLIRYRLVRMTYNFKELNDQCAGKSLLANRSRQLLSKVNAQINVITATVKQIGEGGRSTATGGRLAEILVPFQQKHFGAYRGTEDFRRHPSKTIRMTQDPVAFMQEMHRRMEAMQAEIETLRAERDATPTDRDAGQRAPPSQRSAAPTRTQ